MNPIAGCKHAKGQNVAVLAKPIGPERRQNVLPAYLFDSMSKQIHPIHHFFLRLGPEFCEKDAQEMQGFADSLHVLVINSTDEKRTWSLLPFKPCCGRID